MRKPQAVRNLLKNCQQAPKRILLASDRIGFVQLAKDLFEGFALHELHREVILVVLVNTHIVDWDDVRMFELSSRLRFSQKPVYLLAHRLTSRRNQKLHRNPATQRAISHSYDSAHATLRDLADVLILGFVDVQERLTIHVRFDALQYRAGVLL